MARITPEEFQEKHARRLKGAVEDIRKGVERVSVAPTSQAVAKKDKMKSRLVDAIDSGKWERGLKRVTLDEWKQKIINKGLGRIASGIDGAKEKVTEFARELLPYQDALLANIEKMPDVTLEDNINRMAAWVRGMAKFQRK